MTKVLSYLFYRTMFGDTVYAYHYNAARKNEDTEKKPFRMTNRKKVEFPNDFKRTFQENTKLHQSISKK